MSGKGPAKDGRAGSYQLSSWKPIGKGLQVILNTCWGFFCVPVFKIGLIQRYSGVEETMYISSPSERQALTYL